MDFLRRHSFALTIIFLGIIYAATLRGLPGNLHPNGTGSEKIISNIPPFETSMERGRYAQVLSLAEHQTFSVDAYPLFLKPDLAWYNGHYYAPFPVGVAVLSFPAYLLGLQFHISQVATYAVTTIVSLLTAITIFFICKKLGVSQKGSIIALLSYAIASCAFAYSVTISAHPFSALIIAVLFLIYLTVTPKKKNYHKFVLMWALFGAQLFIDYPNILISLPFVIASILKSATFRRKRGKMQLVLPFSLLISLTSLIAVFLLFVLFNYTTYGKFIAFTNTFNLRPLEQNGINVSPSHLTNAIFAKKAYSSRFTFGTLPSGIHTLLYSQDRGLFFYSPIFLLALVGIGKAVWRRAFIWIPAVCTIAFTVFIYGSYDDPWGGWGFGARYMIVSLPVFAAFVGVGFDMLVKRFLTRVVATALFLFSCAVGLIGALTTNAIPPSVEAVSLHMKDNFLMNWDILRDGYTSSFFYHAYFHQFLNPLSYGIVIASSICLVSILVIWLPATAADEDNDQDMNVESSYNQTLQDTVSRGQGNPAWTV